jgi:hypothetical protein
MRPQAKWNEREVVRGLLFVTDKQNRLCQLFVRSTTQRRGLPRTYPTRGLLTSTADVRDHAPIPNLALGVVVVEALVEAEVVWSPRPTGPRGQGGAARRCRRHRSAGGQRRNGADWRLSPSALATGRRASSSFTWSAWPVLTDHGERHGRATPEPADLSPTGCAAGTKRTRRAGVEGPGSVSCSLLGV